MKMQFNNSNNINLSLNDRGNCNDSRKKIIGLKKQSNK